MPCGIFKREPIQVSSATARINSYSINPTNLANASGTIGDELRLRVKSGVSTIELTPTEANTGLNEVGFNTVLQNGYILCIEATMNGYTSYASECKTIPTPGFGFASVNTA